MKIDVHTARRMAELARIQLDDGECAQLAAELCRLTDYVEMLSALDTDAVEPTVHVEPLMQPLRDDEPGPTLGRAQALALAPEHDGECVVVPQVVGGESRRGGR